MLITFVENTPCKQTRRDPTKNRNLVQSHTVQKHKPTTKKGSPYQVFPILLHHIPFSSPHFPIMITLRDY